MALAADAHAHLLDARAAASAAAAAAAAEARLADDRDAVAELELERVGLEPAARHDAEHLQHAGGEHTRPDDDRRDVAALEGRVREPERRDDDAAEEDEEALADVRAHEAEVACDDLDVELGGDDQPAEEHLEDREGDHAERELHDHVKKSSPVAQSSLSTEAAISIDETITKTAIPMSAKPHAAVYMRRKMEYAWPTSRHDGMVDGHARRVARRRVGGGAEQGRLRSCSVGHCEADAVKSTRRARLAAD